MIKNLSVSAKGFAAFGLLAALTIGTCVFIYARANVATLAVEHNLRMVELLKQTKGLAGDVTHANLLLKSFLLTGDRDYVDTIKALDKKIASEAAGLKTAYEAKATAQLPALAGAMNAFSTWRKDIATRQILLMRDPMTVDLARALELTDHGRALLDEFEARLAAIEADLQKQQAEASTSQVSALSSVVWASLLSALLMGIFAAFLGLLNYRLVSRPLTRLSDVISRLASGDLEVTVDKAGGDEIGDIARAVDVFKDAAVANRRLEMEAEESRRRAESDRIAAQERAEAEAAERLRVATSGLASGLKRLASGDLSFQLNEAFAPEFEALRHDFNQSIGQLSATLRGVAEGVGRMESGTREIASGADSLSKRTEQQAASLEETAAAVEEITSNVVSSSKRTEEARTVAANANASATQSAQVVSDAEDAMRLIEKSAGQISNIIGVIDEIAFQTNLLALNAGVEAARAGDAGRGFAVVAQEVRELAQRSAQAAKEIKQLIQTSSAQVTNGVGLVRNTGEALRTIGSLIVEINGHMDAIATSAREQSTGLSEVNQAVNSMDQMTQQNAAMVEESNAASATLASEAEHLRELITQFKLGSSGGDQAAALRKMTAAMNEPPRRMPAAAAARPARAAIAATHGNTALANADWEEF